MTIEEFISSSYRNVRSSKRTDNLHRSLVTLLIQQKPELQDYTIKYEYIHPCGYGGTFAVDIAFIDADGKCKLAVLAKALNSSVAKNIKNYTNCTVGEAARLMYSSQPPEQVLFITLAPRVTPLFNKHGDVIGFEDVVRQFTNTNPQPILSSQYTERVKLQYIFYDIIGVKDKTSKDEFLHVEFENLNIPCL